MCRCQIQIRAGLGELAAILKGTDFLVLTAQLNWLIAGCSATREDSHLDGIIIFGRWAVIPATTRRVVIFLICMLVMLFLMRKMLRIEIVSIALVFIELIAGIYMKLLKQILLSIRVANYAVVSVIEMLGG
jgi:hypothetical protein